MHGMRYALIMRLSGVHNAIMSSLCIDERANVHQGGTSERRVSFEQGLDETSLVLSETITTRSPSLPIAMLLPY